MTLAVGAGGLVGCSTTTQPGVTPTETVGNLDAFYGQPLTWKRCEGEFFCASFEVPLSYADTDGPRIKLQVVKAPAHDPTHKIGALLLNPGGPGGSAFDYALYSSSSFSQELVDKFDMIGMDPRGVGRSSPIECLTNEQTDRVTSVLGAPTTDGQVSAVVAASASIGSSCQQRSPKLTPNVGTVAAARDMDVLRALLGEDKLNYLGQSYGTFLGLTYADLFTDRVGRFVLDGVIDPALTNEQLARGQADGFQHALGRFIADCRTHRTCPLPRSSDQAARARIDAWLVQLGRKPIKALPGRPLTRALASNGLIASLYDNELGWPQLANALRAGFGGDGAPMVEIVDSFLGRQADGTYIDNSYDSFYAINCLDRTDRADVARTQQLATEWSASAPTFGADLAWSNLPCFGWPAPATDGAHPIEAPGSAPIVLIGTTHDPATPYPWAVAVHQQLANSALITADLDGHTAINRNDCVDKLVDDALVNQKLPPTDANC